MTEDINVYVPGVKHVEVEFISWFTTWKKNYIGLEETQQHSMKTFLSKRYTHLDTPSNIIIGLR